jgi:hypothetical protein
LGLNFWKKRSASESPNQQAVIFIDHDHWFVSLKKQYRVEASIKTLLDSIAPKYDISEIFAFGDFTASDIKLSNLAGITENIFDVRGDMKNDKDILMLDKLYRAGIQYKCTGAALILVSGSGRLTLAARFLKEDCGLKTGVYSVRGCLSGSLKETADWVCELPNEEFISMLFPLIIDNCVHVSKTSNIIPTFKTTVEAVSSYNDVSPVLVEEAVRKMLDLGYLYQKQTVLSSFNTVKTIAANWEQLIKDGLYDPEKD